MLRRSLILASLVFGLFLIELPSAEARLTSRGNPSARSNIHGINYGSMRWERKYGKRRAFFSRSSRSGWRRGR